MPQKQVVYHLGAHKTGSSLLQKFMRDRPDALRQHRIYYLNRGEMNDYVGWGKKLLTRPTLLEHRVADAFADPWYRTLVTSHENTLGPPFKPGATHLYPRGPELVEQLARVLGRWASRAVLYVRPQDEFVESYYLQRVHQGHRQSFAEWLEEVDLEALSWRPAVDALMEHFGPERVDIVDFGLIRSGQDAFVADFLRRIDPDNQIDPSYGPVRNASVSDKGLKIALAANKHLRNDWERKALRKFLQKHFSNQAYPRPVLFTEDEKQQVRATYAREYEALTGRALVTAPDAKDAE